MIKGPIQRNFNLVVLKRFWPSADSRMRLFLHQKTSLQALAYARRCCDINELDDKRLAVSRVESGSSAVADERKRREIESAGLPGTSDMEADSKANSGAKPE